MNILFHLITAIGAAVLLTDTSKPIEKYIAIRCCLIFIVGIFFHGVLDYIPHAYPINSKIDAILSLFFIILAILFTNRNYKFIIAASFFGNIFPDLIDLSSGILNKYLHFNFHIYPKIFPWHWPQYSGSIYKDGSEVSILNHLMILAFALVVCLMRFRDFKEIFLPNRSVAES